MNFAFNKNSYLIWILLLASGCVRELIPVNNGYKPKPVIWALFNLDSTVSIITSGNTGIDNDNVVNMPNATMYIYENGVKVDSLLSQNITGTHQLHMFKIMPKSFKNYKLVISNKTTSLSGEFQMPNTLLKPLEIKLTQGENAQLTYTLFDDVSFNDAYQFLVEIHHFGLLIDTATTDTINKSYSFINYYTKYDEPSLNTNFLGINPPSPSVFTFPVTDNLFNGKNKSFLFTLQNPVSNIFMRFRTPVVGAPIRDKLICTQQYILIKCRKISPEYYKFINSENKNNDIFGTPYFNPTNVYGNINNGLGLIAGMTERADTVWIRK